MTRENKLALVVGFGLVLFVGILVSDHLSAVHREQPPDLNDRLAHRTSRDTTVMEIGSPRTPIAATPATTPIGAQPPNPRTASPPADGPVFGPRWSADPSSTLVEDDRLVRQPRSPGRESQSPPTVDSPEPESAIVMGQTGRSPVTAREHVHVVVPGETLNAIARRHYGTTTIVDRLAAHNGLRNPNALRVGVELRLPPAEALGATGGVLQASDRRTTPPIVRFEEYTVRPGDTLSSIAERFLNSRGRWREIVEHNQDRIQNPDQLRPGTRIRIPSANAGRTSTV